MWRRALSNWRKPMEYKIQVQFDEMRKEMRSEFEELRDAVTYVGAQSDLGWIGFAFTVNYVLLALILWRVW
jgi:hypothetical protein